MSRPPWVDIPTTTLPVLGRDKQIRRNVRQKSRPHYRKRWLDIREQYQNLQDQHKALSRRLLEIRTVLAAKFDPNVCYPPGAIRLDPLSYECLRAFLESQARITTEDDITGDSPLLRWRGQPVHQI